MKWDYRVFKQDTPKSAESKCAYFVAECYYNDADKPHAYSRMRDNNLIATDEGEKGLRDTYDLMAEAFKAPVLELDEEGKFKQ